LKELGLEHLGDLLEYFPRTYQQESAERSVRQLVAGEIQSARGTIVAVNYIPSRPRPRFEATLENDGAKLALVWFHGAYLRARIRPGIQLRARGRVVFFRNLPQMANPKWEIVDDSTALIETTAYRPIYPASSELTTDVIPRIVEDNLDDALPHFGELFDETLLERRHLLPRREAYRKIHLPA